jgi:hypothetical protein
MLVALVKMGNKVVAFVTQGVLVSFGTYIDNFDLPPKERRLQLSTRLNIERSADRDIRQRIEKQYRHTLHYKT